MTRKSLRTWLCLAAMIAAPACADDLTPILIPVQDGVQEFGPTAAPMPPGTIVDGPIIDGPMVGSPVIHQGPIHLDSAPIPLFTRVKVVDRREMHPCAIKKIIKVNDPCASKHDCCESCVYIEICVPPCACDEKVRCRRNGDRVRYDYGKYAVDVRVKRGFIVVDYQK